MAAYFVSDIHIQGPDDLRARLFLDLLRAIRARAKSEPSSLYLVGDIFDLWIGGHSHFHQQYRVLVDELKVLIAHGVAVHYFEGNHDLHLRSFWEKEVGAKVYLDCEYFEIEGQRVRVEHGDLMNPDDRGYLFLRWLLRTPFMTAVALNLPSALIKALGERASAASRRYTSGQGRKSVDEKRIREIILRHAQKVYGERPFDLLVSGHVHVRDDQFFRGPIGQEVRVTNLGSWMLEAPVLILKKAQLEWADVRTLS